MEISRIQGHSSLGDHPACDRGIDTAGQEQLRFSVGANRHSARSRNDLRIDEDLIAHFDIEHHGRVMHIDFHFTGKSIQELRADFRIHIHRTDRIVFIGPAGVHLECDRIRLNGHSFAGAFHRILHGNHVIGLRDVPDRILGDRVRILHRHLHDLADADQSENLLQRSDHLIGIKAVIVSKHVRIDAALLLVYVKLPFHMGQCVSDLQHQRVLKLSAVLSLDADLAIFQ